MKTIIYITNYLCYLEKICKNPDFLRQKSIQNPFSIHPFAQNIGPFSKKDGAFLKNIGAFGESIAEKISKTNKKDRSEVENH